MIEPNLVERRVPIATGVTLHVAEAGNPSGPPILLLHGFPDRWWGWCRQIGPLAAAGLRVIVPDLRGYGESSAPGGVAAYRLDPLVADVIALADALEIGRFHLVGHDWGGIIAWAAAARHPGRITRLAVLNAPHLDAFAGVVRRHPRQLLRSAYVGFFQLSGFAEAALRARDFSLLKRMVQATAHPGSFAPGELDRYARGWAPPRRLTAMLAYYRALARLPRPPLGRVTVPTTLLWGMDDKALDFALAEASLAFCTDARLISFPRASHWLQRDEPGRVAEILRGHALGPARG